MTHKPNLTEAAVRRLASAQSYERGEEYYYYSGAVLDVALRGSTLQAEVEGSQYEPYQVTVELDEAGIVSTYCSCPYDWGGICKHIVAVLLTYIRNPDRVRERPPLSELLDGLNRETLRDLLVELLADRPSLADWIESRVAARRAQEQAERETERAPHQRRTPLDVEAFRRQVRRILRSGGGGYYDDYWDTDGAISELEDMLSQAQTFIEAGDGDNALLILGALAEELMGEEWLALAYGDNMLYFFDEMGQAFAEAILSAELSAEEREEWARRLREWAHELEDYGYSSFDVAIGAAELGWDYEPLQRAMRSDFDQRGAWEGEAPVYADELAIARLNVLERQGRTEEYLNLAEAEGQTERYVTMLVKLGRYDEALDYGLKYLATPGEVLALAKALREHDKVEAALRVAHHGLHLEYEPGKGPLAEWLRDLAGGLGERDIALEAAVVAFKTNPSLEAYQAAENLAGDAWPARREALLRHLREREAHISSQALVDVFLYEDMIDEAIRVADRHSYYTLVEQVVDAVWERRPEWAIRACRQQAEPIIEGGQADRYHHAVRWLEKARRAAKAAGRLDEWRVYVEDIRRRHSRKYKLVPMLDALLEE